MMSPQQTAFLKDALELAKDAKHVFVFLHHPRWTGGRYGNDWGRVHQLLKGAGNVSACFAGHTHRMHFDGSRDNIDYYTLATTGGVVSSGGTINRFVGALHHYDLVTVRGDVFHVAAVPVGTVIDPKAERFTQILLEQETWMVRDEATRTLRYPIAIPTLYDGSKAILQIGVAHGADDNGDKGVTYALESAGGQTIQRGFLSASDYEWIKYPAKSDEKLVFLLEDKDTSFETEHPGNGGHIQIELEVVVR
jgi:hypothetical protein